MKVFNEFQKDLIDKIVNSDEFGINILELLDEYTDKTVIRIDLQKKKVQLLFELENNTPTPDEMKFIEQKINELTRKIKLAVDLINYLSEQGQITLYTRANNVRNIIEFGVGEIEQYHIGNEFSDIEAKSLLIQYSEKYILVSEELKAYVNKSYKTKEDLKYEKQSLISIIGLIIAITVAIGSIIFGLITLKENTKANKIAQENLILIKKQFPPNIGYSIEYPDLTKDKFSYRERNDIDPFKDEVESVFLKNYGGDIYSPSANIFDIISLSKHIGNRENTVRVLFLNEIDSHWHYDTHHTRAESDFYNISDNYRDEDITLGLFYVFKFSKEKNKDISTFIEFLKKKNPFLSDECSDKAIQLTYFNKIGDSFNLYFIWDGLNLKRLSAKKWGNYFSKVGDNEYLKISDLEAYKEEMVKIVSNQLKKKNSNKLDDIKN